MFGWQAAKVAVEAEGIYIGGWDPRNIVFPRRVNGHHGQFHVKSNAKPDGG